MKLQLVNQQKRLHKSSLILKHVLGWLLFILYETGFIYITTGRYGSITHYLVFYILNIGLFYLNAYLILPFSFEQSPRSYLFAAFLISIEMCSYLSIKYLLDYTIDTANQAVHITPQQKYWVMNLWRGLYFLGFSTLYWSVVRMIDFRRRVYEVEKQQLSADKGKAELERNLVELQNAYLHQQINPHFLFNTLNFIYNNVYKYSTEAGECLMLLAEIMRYSLEEIGTDGKRSLSKEIEQIGNFIRINRFRYDYDLYIDFKITGNYENGNIIPLILLTLTENIFKHGNLKRPESVAKLYIILNEHNELTFYSWNLKKSQTEKKRISAIGMKNTVKRLEHSYKHWYKLTISDKEESYELELKMQL